MAVDVAMVLAIVFFCSLVLSFAAITFLLIRYCLAASCRRSPDDPERQAPRLGLAAAVAPPEPEHDDDELSLVILEPRRLTWREVEALTGGFPEAAVVGRGGSSTVYLARLRHGAPVAVKVHRWCGAERRRRAFRQELDLLRRLHHPHIVKLLAYSDDHGVSTVYIYACFFISSLLIYSDFPSSPSYLLSGFLFQALTLLTSCSSKKLYVFHYFHMAHVTFTCLFD
jgi:hypothetical protein